MFKAKKLTRNFAQGSLFRPLGHSRQFFVGALTTSGVLGIVAFGLMTKASIEVHVMPEKATDTSAEVKTSQAHGSSPTVAEVSTTPPPVESQQATTSQPIPAKTEPAAKSISDTTQTLPKAIAPAAETKQVAQTTTTTLKNDTAATIDLSTLGVRAITGVNVPL